LLQQHRRPENSGGDVFVCVVLDRRAIYFEFVG
jgi:hypothetical protein